MFEVKPCPLWHSAGVSADPAVPPSGVVTFLFTDVEGSTRRWENDAEGMRAALAAHDEVLRAAIAAHGGRLFKHTGDGVCAAFASPSCAVDAAVAAQRELELPVRMGIATGEAELRGADYFGAVLNRAARVMAAGHGGQILLAESTAVLLSGLDLVDLGPRRLRDLPTPVGVFQVRVPGLRTDFPPVRALDASPGNLRPQLTSFIGREHEVADVQAVLRPHRLVTLIGVGGVGKTRLALEVATSLVDEFPDGVWLFELAAVADPAAVPDAVAAVLGITQQPGQTLADSVAAALEGRVRLLVIGQLRTSAGRRRRSGRSHPGPLGDGDHPGHQPRRTGARRRATVAGAVAGCRCGHRLRRSRSVRRTCPQRGLALRAGPSRGGGRGHRNLPPPRRDTAGDRAGGLTDGVDDGQRGARSS